MIGITSVDRTYVDNTKYTLRSDIPSVFGASFGNMFNEENTLGQGLNTLEVNESQIEGQSKEDAVSSIYKAIRLRGKNVDSGPTSSLYTNTLEENLRSYDNLDALDNEFINNGIKRNERLTVSAESPMSFERAVVLSSQYDEKDKRDKVLEYSTGFGNNILKGLGYLSGMIADPTNFIPITGTEALAAKGSRLALSSMAKRGAIEGAVGNAIVEPIIYAGKANSNQEYSLKDSVLNITLGGILGGALGTGAGALSNFINRSNRRKLNNVLDTSIDKINSDLTNQEDIDFSNSMFNTPDTVVKNSPDDNYRKFLDEPEDFDELDGFEDEMGNNPFDDDFDEYDIENIRSNSPESFKEYNNNTILKENKTKELKALDIIEECFIDELI